MTDDDLRRAFTTSTLAADAWTHRTHLRVAWLHLSDRDLDLDEAHLFMRVGIIRLNAFHGLVETPERGYHETLTRVWLALVRSLMLRQRAASSEAFVDAHAAELDKSAPLRHYTKGTLMSLRARVTFVEPDLTPLP